MKTDDLISLLATGLEPVDQRTPGRHLFWAGAMSLIAAVAITAGLIGLRAGLFEEFPLPMFWVREAFCAALSIAGVILATRLARPGARLGLAPATIVLSVIFMWLLGAWVLLNAAPQERAGLVMGQTALVCPFLIALVSAPMFAAIFWLMKGLAPTRLRLAGAAGGFAAGATGALVYTLHCPEIAAPFLAVWYVLGMLIPSALGAALGPTLLRW